MKGKYALLPAALAGILLFGSVAGAEETERSVEELQRLLQESLTITEIDREVERLSQEQVRIRGELEQTEIQIEEQSEVEGKLRERAGKVLRAYYMRDRQNLWLLLLHSDSFSNALTVFQYLQTIAENDRLSIERYLAAREKLLALKTELENRLQELEETKAEWLRQRERVIALQAELDRKLAEAADREAIIAQMEALNRLWHDEGLPYFQSFLEAMSGALAELPDYLNVYPDSLTQERLRVVFTVREAELNDFLREKNPLFREFSIDLTDAGLTITGSRGELSIGVDGRFELVETPDAPALRFLLVNLRFGPYELPDTTVADMQRRFSMTFSTKQHEMTSFLMLTGVEHRDGELAINMNIDI